MIPAIRVLGRPSLCEVAIEAYRAFGPTLGVVSFDEFYESHAVLERPPYPVNRDMLYFLSVRDGEAGGVREYHFEVSTSGTMNVVSSISVDGDGFAPANVYCRE